MKLVTLFLIIILTLGLFGCGAETESETTEPAPAEPEVPAAEPAEVVNEPAPAAPLHVEQPPAKQMSSEVTDILDGAKDVTSVKYVYHGPPIEQEAYSFAIKGNIAKMTMSSKTKYDASEFYDVIIFDLNAETATAYCESFDCDPKGARGSLDYNSEYKLTPFDWLDNIEYAEIVGEEDIDNQVAIKMDLETKSGQEGIIWIDEYRGIPVKVIVGDDKWEYTRFSANSVQDSEVEPSI